MVIDPSLDAEDYGQVVVAIVTVSLVGVTAAVAARFYTRLILLSQFGLDDYAAVFSLVTTWACSLAIGLSVQYGSGRHIWTLTPDDIVAYMRNFYLSIVFYNMSIMATKAAFLLQYYRVLAVDINMKRIYLASLCLVGSWCTEFVLVAIFQCSPIPDFWSLSPTRNCIPAFPYWRVQSVGHIVTDLMLFTLPLPALVQLRINRTQKVVLIGVFSLGFVAGAISVVRLNYLRMTEDVTWENMPMALWSVGEISLGLICACLPTLRPLIVRIFPEMGSTMRKNAKGARGKSGGPGSSWYLKYGSGFCGSNHAPSVKVATPSVSAVVLQHLKLESSRSMDKQRVTAEIGDVEAQSPRREKFSLDRGRGWVRSTTPGSFGATTEQFGATTEQFGATTEQFGATTEQFGVTTEISAGRDNDVDGPNVLYKGQHTPPAQSDKQIHIAREVYQTEA